MAENLSFAGKELRHFKRYIKDGVLDEAALMAQEGLNERQIPQLRALLEEGGYLNAPAPVVATPEPRRPRRGEVTGEPI